MLHLGYNTNGLSGLRASQAVHLLADIGYAGLALTLDADVLNPYADDFSEQLHKTHRALNDRGLRCVIETGARFLLDKHVKHEPTLVSTTTGQRLRRIDFLCRSIDVARSLSADCVSLWSGAVRDGAGYEEAMDRLVSGLTDVLKYAAARDVIIAFEPEPGMLIETMTRYAELREALAAAGADLSALRLTLDIGHLHCQGEVPIADHIRIWGDQLANVHIEDMRAGVHEHLQFGEGEIDFPPVIAALAEIGYSGLINVELSRHSHEGPRAAHFAMDFLKPLAGRAENACGY